MKSWNYVPAQDIELKPVDRARSLKREPGIWSWCGHLAWTGLVKSYTRLYHRLEVAGREHLPQSPPFVMIANHTSHLDAMVLASAIPLRHCGCVFPVAAGDVFFEDPARSLFSAQFINALPMWRKNCGPHALGELRNRLIHQPCAYILFPEGAAQPQRFAPALQGRPRHDHRRHSRPRNPVCHRRSGPGLARGFVVAAPA